MEPFILTSVLLEANYRLSSFYAYSILFSIARVLLSFAAWSRQIPFPRRVALQLPPLPTRVIGACPPPLESPLLAARPPSVKLYAERAGIPSTTEASCARAPLLPLLPAQMASASSLLRTRSPAVWVLSLILLGHFLFGDAPLPELRPMCFLPRPLSVFSAAMPFFLVCAQALVASTWMRLLFGFFSLPPPYDTKENPSLFSESLDYLAPSCHPGVSYAVVGPFFFQTRSPADSCLPTCHL